MQLMAAKLEFAEERLETELQVVKQRATEHEEALRARLNTCVEELAEARASASASSALKEEYR